MLKQFDISVPSNKYKITKHVDSVHQSNQMLCRIDEMTAQISQFQKFQNPTLYQPGTECAAESETRSNLL